MDIKEIGRFKDLKLGVLRDLAELLRQCVSSFEELGTYSTTQKTAAIYTAIQQMTEHK
jgi:hypothetical protein